MIWLGALFLVLYPLIAPWRRSFIVGWLAIWFSLWALFFVRADYESAHVVKGMLSGSSMVGVAIFLFAVASSLRALGREVVQWWRRKPRRAQTLATISYTAQQNAARDRVKKRGA
jgi:hypothetical protein